MLSPKAIEEQEKTYQDLLNKLQKYGKCAVIRPTGFGKTTMMIRLLPSYKKALFCILMIL